MSNQRLKYPRWWLCFCIIVTLVSFNIGKEAIAQSLYSTDSVILSQKNSNPLTSSISARELFRSAYENRYTWDLQFPGYTALVELKHGQENYKGRIRVNPDMSVEVTNINEKDARQAVENQVRMSNIHRRRVPFEVAHKNSTFKFGTTDTTGAVKIFEQQADKLEAHYKVFNRQLMQVNRVLGQTAVIVDILDSEVTPKGYFATRYRTTFRQPQTKQVLGEMESEDFYKKVDCYYLITHQVTHEFKQEQQTSTEIEFNNIQLLPTNS